MSTVKPFRAVRPVKEHVKEVAALPYDVYTREEAAEFVKTRPLSFLNIDRPETAFKPTEDMYSQKVYDHARKTYEEWKAKGIFMQDENPCYYIYELTMDGRSQTGIVGATAVKDYETGVCKKHENTVAEKEADRINHVYTMSAQTGPIFLAYHKTDELSQIVSNIKETTPEYDFVTEEGIGERVWVVSDPEAVKKIEEGFGNVPNTYIADGHHRAASAVKVSQRKRTEGADMTEAEYFLSVLFPDDELKIMDYNRYVLDLNGMSAAEFIDRINKDSAFTVSEAASFEKPLNKFEVSMYLEGKPYTLTVKDEYAAKVEKDPVKVLDVSVLQDTVLSPILGIGDPRTDKRIKFIGGIKGIKPLMEMAQEKGVSFAMYPTSMQELFGVADAGLLMPPKSTWFEPKLRSGIFIHEI
ncbi:MAG: DUF1015 domain-containing protein [Eubacteriales bacterium]|nr:DUF1015 domain-containing protein [Eubacteriales bacterium]